jgi:hypothetical protein
VSEISTNANTNVTKKIVTKKTTFASNEEDNDKERKKKCCYNRFEFEFEFEKRWNEIWRFLRIAKH